MNLYENIITELEKQQKILQDKIKQIENGTANNKIWIQQSIIEVDGQHDSGYTVYNDAVDDKILIFQKYVPFANTFNNIPLVNLRVIDPVENRSVIVVSAKNITLNVFNLELSVWDYAKLSHVYINCTTTFA